MEILHYIALALVIGGGSWVLIESAQAAADAKREPEETPLGVEAAWPDVDTVVGYAITTIGLLSLIPDWGIR